MGCEAVTQARYQPRIEVTVARPGGTPIRHPDTLIGKALEPLKKGVGEILVLLSLQ